MTWHSSRTGSAHALAGDPPASADAPGPRRTRASRRCPGESEDGAGPQTVLLFAATGLAVPAVVRWAERDRARQATAVPQIA